MATQTISSLPPAEICGYRVMRALSPGASFLALEPQGRQVVLTKLDGDCLLQNQLHPSIKERLSRVRELPHAGTANLFGVERDSHGVFLVWEYLAGESFDELTQSRRCSQHRLAILTRELVLTVESLHAQGIVHGAIKPGNVIVTGEGRVRLTHVSPLLYDDPREDEKAVLSMISEIVVRRQEQESPLGRALNEIKGRTNEMRALATHLVGIARVAASMRSDPTPEVEAPTIRRTAIIGALLAGFLGILLALGVWYWVHDTQAQAKTDWTGVSNNR